MEASIGDREPDTMRLWSLHPKYLDTKGLLALWREGLLAQKVLEGRTRGYRNHPQLLRFKEHKDTRKAIGNYLWEVWREATARDYSFTRCKVHKTGRVKAIPITRGQLRYEWEHLGKKLRKRDPARWRAIKPYQRIQLHPSFRVVPGKIAKWEKA
jgi:hypothetical protein